MYVIFESEKQIRLLLNACSVQEGNSSTARKYFYKISGKYLKTQKVIFEILFNSISIITDVL